MQVIVVGGGKVGYYLVKTLVDEGHRVCLLERDSEICSRVAQEFNIMVINGDGTDPSCLEEANVADADVVAAVTGKDEVNLVVCQLVKSRFMVPRTIARVSNPKNVRIVQKLGVDVAVSSTSVIADLIENQVTVGELKTLMTFPKGDMVMVEVVVPPHSPVANRAVQQLPLPTDCVLVSIIREGKVILPRGNTVLREMDTVLAMTTTETRTELRRILLGR